jgi:hypothetical protein
MGARARSAQTDPQNNQASLAELGLLHDDPVSPEGAGMRQCCLVHLATVLAGIPAVAAGQRIDTMTRAVVVPGVVHRHLVYEGPWDVHVIEVDLRQPGLVVRAAHANDQLRGRETVSGISRRKSSDSAMVVAAINADFFNLKTGEAENNQIVDGEIWKAVQVNETPTDSGHHIRTQVAVRADGRLLLEKFVFRGTLVRPGGGVVRIDAINSRPTRSATVLYTGRFGPMTPWDSSGSTIDVRLRPVSRAGDTVTFQVASFPFSGGTARLSDGAALSLPRDIDSVHDVPRPGEMVRFVAGFRPSTAPLRALIGGWPRLILHGQSVADSADRIESTSAAFSVTRHPRSGVGISRDSATLYLVTVDGRQESSSGVSLVDFAKLMLSLGIYEGVNLDGGGSTTMIVAGKVVNHPSDLTGERTISNALLVVQTRHD